MKAHKFLANEVHFASVAGTVCCSEQASDLGHLSLNIGRIIRNESIYLYIELKYWSLMFTAKCRFL